MFFPGPQQAATTSLDLSHRPLTTSGADHYTPHLQWLPQLAGCPSHLTSTIPLFLPLSATPRLTPYPATPRIDFQLSEYVSPHWVWRRRGKTATYGEYKLKFQCPVEPVCSCAEFFFVEEQSITSAVSRAKMLRKSISSQHPSWFLYSISYIPFCLD